MNAIDTFEDMRSRLTGLAYRLLGSYADAEDAVQETYLKWNAVDRSEIETPAAWLTTVCTRLCLDTLKSARRSRTDYVGTWLPEPVSTEDQVLPDERLALADSLSMAFLVVLERLAPKERAAYLLHEIFDMSYADLAGLLDISETACRKLVSRARRNIGKAHVRHVTPSDVQERFLNAFKNAVETGSADTLAALLSEDVQLHADGGGVVPAIGRVLIGPDEVLGFATQGLREFWRGFAWQPADINGTRGYLMTDGDRVIAAVSFAFDRQGRTTDIFIMRNPDKLGTFAKPVETGSHRAPWLM